jgi:uncharacterized membrane protein YdfJ with MMPL/SSD domain
MFSHGLRIPDRLHSALIQKKCLAKLPLIIDCIQNATIRLSLLPRLVELGTKATDMKVVAAALVSVARCIGKVDQDIFLQDRMLKPVQT